MMSVNQNCSKAQSPPFDLTMSFSEIGDREQNQSIGSESHCHDFSGEFKSSATNDKKTVSSNFVKRKKKQDSVEYDYDD